MPALDTNVLVRWLVRDDEAQFAAASRVLEAAARSGRPAWVPVTVLLELQWVLRARYRLGRAGLIATLDALLSVPALAFAEEVAVERALWRFKRDRRSDFADCLHIALAEAENTLPLMTFDVRAGSLPGARPIPA